MPNTIKDILTASQFANLEAVMGISPHRKTKLTRNPRIATLREFRLLMKLSGLDKKELKEMDIGTDGLTLSDFDDLPERIKCIPEKGVFS